MWILGLRASWSIRQTRRWGGKTWGAVGCCGSWLAACWREQWFGAWRCLEVGMGDAPVGALWGALWVLRLGGGYGSEPMHCFLDPCCQAPRTAPPLQGMMRRGPDGALLARTVSHRPTQHATVPDGMTIDAGGLLGLACCPPA